MSNSPALHHSPNLWRQLGKQHLPPLPHSHGAVTSLIGHRQLRDDCEDSLKLLAVVPARLLGFLFSHFSLCVDLREQQTTTFVGVGSFLPSFGFQGLNLVLGASWLLNCSGILSGGFLNEKQSQSHGHLSL